PERAVNLLTCVIGDYGALDMRLMSRVLDNLLNNALRYSRTTVQVSLLLDGSQATLIVEDDGPGIEADARERIFEPFV
ncbi:sensor protein RstB, partial [Salmonella enterica subsp. enterica serovar Enteritidis str. SE30663]